MSLLALQQAAAAADLFSFDLTVDDVVGGWLICFFTLAVFSFLYRDNPFYKLAEHVFVGVGTAWFTMQYYEEGVKQPLVEYIERQLHMAERNADALPGAVQELAKLGGVGITPELAIGLRIGACALAVMLLLRLVRPNSWMPRWPLALMVGVYAALKMTGETQSKLILPVTEVMKLVAADDLGRLATIGNVILVVGLVCALTHFLFTYRRGPVLATVSRVGIITLMVTFGSMFGFTVLGRIALLIERIDQLGQYTGPDHSLWPGGQSWTLEAGGLQLDMAQVTSPPFLVAIVITLLLALGALQRRAGRSQA